MSGKIEVFLTLVLWPIIPIVDKIGLAGKRAPLGGMAARMLVAMAFLIPVLVISPGIRGELQTFGRREWLAFGASGLISLLLAQYFYYSSLEDHDVARLFPFLFGGAPVLTMLLALHFLGEVVSLKAWAGGGLIFAGSLLMFW